MFRAYVALAAILIIPVVLVFPAAELYNALGRGWLAGLITVTAFWVTTSLGTSHLVARLLRDSVTE